METTKAVREKVAPGFPTVRLFVVGGGGYSAARDQWGGGSRYSTGRKSTSETRSGGETGP